MLVKRLQKKKMMNSGNFETTKAVRGRPRATIGGKSSKSKPSKSSQPASSSETESVKPTSARSSSQSSSLPQVVTSKQVRSLSLSAIESEKKSTSYAKMKKSDLILECKKFGLSTKGNVEELRMLKLNIIVSFVMRKYV